MPAPAAATVAPPLLSDAYVQSPAAAGRWKGHPVARAAVRPAAQSALVEEASHSA